MSTAHKQSEKPCAQPQPPGGPAKRRRVITSEVEVWIHARVTDISKIPSSELTLAKYAIDSATTKFQDDLEKNPALQTLAEKHGCHICFGDKGDFQIRWDSPTFTSDARSESSP